MAAGKTFLLALLLFALLPAAHAVGFANLPASTEIVFSPGKTVEVPLYVVRGEHIDVTLAVPANIADPAGKARAQRLLAYTSLEDAAPGTGQRAVTLRIAFPAEMEPGTYLVDVLATDRPPQQEATIVAVATVKMRFTVRVLSPDPLLEVTGMQAPPIAQGLPAQATLTLTSRSTQDIAGVRALVRVHGADGTLLASATTREMGVRSGEMASLAASLPTEALEGGDYDVDAVVSYAGKEAHGSAVLKIGTLHVGVAEHSPSLLYNATNRFSFTLRNEWNRELRGVYAHVRLAGTEKKTASQDISAFGTAPYEVYFDRDPALMPGRVPVNLTVSYTDYDPASGAYVAKEESFALEVEVMQPAAEERPALMLSTLALMGLLGVLAALLATTVLLLVRSRRGPGDGARPGEPRAPTQAPEAQDGGHEAGPRGP